MKFRAVLWCWLVLLFVAGQWAQALPVARLRNVQPLVEVRLGDNKSFRPGQNKMALSLGSIIRASAAGRTDILFANGTQVALRSGAQLQIVALETATQPLVIRVFGALSEVFVRPRGKTQVRTAAAIAAARGTEYLVRLVDENTTRVVVTEGSVRFFNASGEVVVEAGQSSQATLGQAPSTPIATDVSGLIEWTLDVTALPLPWDETFEGATYAPVTQALTQRRYAAAREPINQLLRDSPRDARAHVLGALLELRTGNATAGISAAQTATQLDPSLVAGHIVLAQSQLTHGATGSALNAARQAVALAPQSAPALGTLAQVLLFSGRSREATQTARRALDIDPLSAPALATLGRAQLAEGDLETARTTLGQASALDPESVPTLLDLGAVYLRLGMLQRAEATFRHLLTVDATSGAAQAGLGETLVRTGRADEGLIMLRQVVAEEPKNATARASLAGALLVLGRLEDADRELTAAAAAMTERPAAGALWIRAAELQLVKGDLVRAGESARKAVELLPSSAQAHYQLGRVFLEQGRTLSAETEFRLAATLDRRFAEARYAFGFTQEQNETNRAGLRAPAAIAPSSLGSAGGAVNIQNLDTPGASERIQAALQDPAVVRAASRSFGDNEVRLAGGTKDTLEGRLSHLSTPSDRRGVWGVNLEHLQRDGVQINSDQRNQRLGVTLGTMSANGDKSGLGLGSYNRVRGGLNTGRLSPFFANARETVETPSLLFGGRWDGGGGSTRAFVRYIHPEAEVRGLIGGSRTDQEIRSLHAEGRHDRRLSRTQGLIFGGSLGERELSAQTTLVLPPVDLVSGTTTNFDYLQLYARHEWQITPQWRLSSAASWRRIEADTVSRFAGSSTLTTAGQSNFLPTLLLEGQVSERTSIRARLRGLRGTIRDFELLAPSDLFVLDDLELPRLAVAQGRGRSAELEAGHTLGNGSFARLVLFDQDLKNAREPSFDDSGDLLPRAKVRGVRLTYEGLLTPTLSLFTSAGWQSARNEVTGDRIINVPKYTAEMGLQYLNQTGFFVQPVYFYRGDIVSAPAGSTPRGGFGVLNLRVGKRQGLRQTLFVEGRNLFDKRYDVQGDFQPGRQLIAGIVQRF